MIKPVQPVAGTIVQRTVQSQTSANQTNQSSNALQELVESVVSAARPKPKPKRIVKITKTPTKQPSEEGSSTSDKSTTNYTTLNSANTSVQSDTSGMGLYGQTQQEHEQVAVYGDSVNAENNDVKLQMTEYINVGEPINPTSGDSGTYTQQEGFELVDENISDRQDTDEHMGQNSFEMEIVDMDVNGMFPDDTNEQQQQQQTPQQQQQQQQDSKAEILESAARAMKDVVKKYKCKQCEKSFATWKSLAMHRHIHSGRTKCTICGAVLSRTANLKRHMKLKHG
ncbi:AGAP010063-PA-like protein [Anopheles sinensis]|uniref:AGAP010063-PA-like protein n=1 Tax=Anopheles sinensis TaxID=74873 RepID=A0A084W3Z5_ANOSI|nr:AGAP010063-PA-like protein [Anopheles sinensis]